MTTRRRTTRPRSTRSRNPRLWIAVGVVVAILVGVGVWAMVALAPSDGPAASSSPAAEEPRALTTDEAERLSVGRFLAFQDGSREFSADVPTADGSVSLHGRVDYREEIGIAAATLDGGAAVISWDADTLVGWVGAGDGTTPPDAPPPTPGAPRDLDPATSTLDTVLVLVSSLGVDRPENAQLLQRSDARWLRDDTVDGVDVDVIAGPADADTGEGAGTTRFWIDDTGVLRRFEADLPSGTVSVTLRPTAYAAIPRAPELG